MRPDCSVYLSSRLTCAKSTNASPVLVVPTALYAMKRPVRGSANAPPTGTAMLGNPGAGRTAVADYVYEICCTDGQDREGAVAAWADRDAAPAWAALPGLT